LAVCKYSISFVGSLVTPSPGRHIALIFVPLQYQDITWVVLDHFRRHFVNLPIDVNSHIAIVRETSQTRNRFVN
jgi:hypothetical protein